MSRPRVSILMPVYNREAFLRPAIDSIRAQTFGDFELILIDDGSTDGSPEVMDEAASQDRRIVVWRQENAGISTALNRGLDLARGELLARMDSDDLSAPDRLERQVRFLDHHPSVGIVGTNFQWMAAEGELGEVAVMPETDLAIRWASLTRCPFAHPTIMIRREVMVEHGLRYCPEWDVVEDFELYPRILKHTSGANLADVLHYLRVHPGSICQSRRAVQLALHDRVACRTIREVLPECRLTAEQISDICRLYLRRGYPLPESDPRRVAICRSALDLLRHFARRYAGHPELGAVVRGETRRMMSVLSGVPASADLAGLLLQLVRANPRLCLLLLRGLSRPVAGLWRRTSAEMGR